MNSPGMEMTEWSIVTKAPEDHEHRDGELEPEGTEDGVKRDHPLQENLSCSA